MALKSYSTKNDASTLSTGLNGYKTLRTNSDIVLRTLDNMDNPYLKRHYSQSENKRVEYAKIQKAYEEKYSKQKGYTFDYNDPTQINSFADVILDAFSPAAKLRQKYKDNALYKILDLTDAPEILEVLTGTADLFKRGTLDPLLNGDFKTVGLNALVNVGETLDVPGTIVKSALFEGTEGVKKAINYDGTGRKNYDFDTGNFASDLALEILVDPMNWISLGGSALAKTFTKGVGKEIASEVAEKVTKEVSQEMTDKGTKALAKRAIKAYTKGDYDTLSESANAILKNFSKDSKFQKYFTKELTKEEAIKVLKNTQTAVLEINSNAILDGIRKLTIPQEAYESFMLKGALSGTGIYPAYKSFKYAGGKAKDLIHLKQYKSWEVAMKDVTKADGTLDVFKYDEILKTDTEFKNVLDVVKNYNDLDDAGNRGVLEIALNSSINHDLNMIDDLLIKHDKNIIEFDTALRGYLGIGKTENLAIEEYLNQINKINKLTNNNFEDVEKILTDLKEEISYKIKTINGEVTFKFNKTQSDYIEVTKLHVNEALSPNTLTRVVKDSLKYYDDLSYELSPIEFYKVVNEDTIITKISSDLAKYYEPIMNELKQIVELPDDYIYIKNVASDALDRLTRYTEDLNKQLNTTFKRELTTTLYEDLDKLLSLNLNFEKLKLIDTFNSNTDKVLDDLNKIMTKAPTFEGHNYTNLVKYLKHKEQAEALDKVVKLTDKVQKDLGSEIYIKPDNIKEIQKVQEYLKDTIKGDTENFLYSNNLEGYADGLNSAIDEFLNVPLNNSELYFDTYNNLSRLLYQVKDQSTDSKAIDEILDKLQDVSPYRVEEAKITVRQGAIIRQLKEEMTYANLSLMNIESFNDLIISGITKNEGLGAFINTMAKAELPENSPFLEVQTAANTLINGAEHYRNYKRLLDRLVSLKLHDDLKNRLLSTLQKYANYNPMNIYNNFDNFVNRIIRDSEDFEYSVKYKRSLSLDVMRDNEEVKDILDRLIGNNSNVKNAHQALYDVYSLQAVMEHEGLIEKYCTDPSKNYILFDIETLSTNAKQGSIFEIAYKDLKGQGNQLNLKLDPINIEHQITDDLVRLFGVKDSNEFYKLRSGDIPSERAMLQNFIDMVKSYRGNAVLIGHNSDKFDVDYLIKRMRNAQISEYDIQIFRDTMKLDTLSLLKAKDGYKVFQPDEVNRVKNLLRNYLDSQLKAGVPKFIAPNNGRMASALNDMRQCLNDVLNNKINSSALNLDYSAETLKYMSKSFGDIAGEIFNTMRDIKNINKQLSHHFLMPELFDDMSDVSKVFNEQLDKIFGEHVPIKNASQLLYGNISDMVNIYGYKNAVDFDKIMRWTYIKEGDEIDFSLGKSLTSLAKHLDRTRDAITDIRFLDGKEKQLNNILEILLPKFKFSGKLSDMVHQVMPLGRLGYNDFYSNLNITYNDSLSSFVMAQYLYNVYKNKNMLTPAIMKALGEDNLNFLNNSSEAFKKSFYQKGINFKALTIDSDIAKPEDIQRLINEFNTNVINPLEKLGEQDIYRARTHAMSMSLMPTQKLLNVYNDTMKSLGMNEQVELLDNLKAYTNNLGMQQLNQTLSLSPEELYKHMVYNAPWIEFSIKDIDSNKALESALNNLIAHENFKELGFKLINDDFNRAYIVNTNLKRITYNFDKASKTLKAYYDGVEIPRATLKELDLDSASNYINKHTDLVNNLSGARNSIHNLSEQTSIGSLCDVLNVEGFRELYSQLPNNVRNILPTVDTLTAKELFTNVRYNHINIGTIESRKLKQRYTHNTIISSYKKHAEITALETKLKINYSSLYYGKEFAINNSEFFKDSNNDAAIINAFKSNPEYVLSALVKDEKYGHRAVILDATNPKLLAEARRLDAVVLPRKVLSKVMETVNYDLMNSYRSHWWNKLLYTYKVGYLLSPSVWFRNIVDSSLKTMVTTEQPLETLIANKEAIKDISLYNKIINGVINLDQYDLAKVKLYGLEETVEKAIKKEKASEVLTALNIINKYDEMVEDIIRLSPQRVGYKKFSKENMEFYFREMNPELDRETFDLVDAFIKDGPSAGLTSAWTKYYGEDYDSVWHTFTNLANKALSPNNKIEQVNRLAEYLLLTKYGDNQNKAFYKVMKTHFDYADKEGWEIYTELIFPFYSFTMKNLEYWVDIAENNPAIIRQLENVMTPITNLDGYDKDDIALNQSLQYQIMSGNIPINDEGLTLKTSPSFMDSFNLIFDPLSSAKGKMFGPLQHIIDYAAKKTGSEVLQNVLNTYTYDSGQALNKALDSNYKDLSGYGDIPHVGGSVQNITENIQSMIKSFTDSTDLTNYGINDIDEKNFIYDSTPILGTILRKVLEQGPMYYERTNSLLNLVAPGMFGATNIYKAKQNDNPYRIYPKYPKNNSSKSSSKWVDYSTNHRSYGRSYRRNYASYSYNSNHNYKKHYYNKWVYPNSTEDVGFYKKHYTKNGDSRLLQLMRPNNSYNLKYKIINTKNYYNSK